MFILKLAFFVSPDRRGHPGRRVTDSRCLCAARGPILAFASSAIVAWMALASPG